MKFIVFSNSELQQQISRTISNKYPIFVSLAGTKFGGPWYSTLFSPWISISISRHINCYQCHQPYIWCLWELAIFIMYTGSTIPPAIIHQKLRLFQRKITTRENRPSSSLMAKGFPSKQPYSIWDNLLNYLLPSNTNNKLKWDLFQISFAFWLFWNVMFLRINIYS